MATKIFKRANNGVPRRLRQAQQYFPHKQLAIYERMAEGASIANRKSQMNETA
jgi:hypothetical protein